jgi:hypothetical protein
MAGYVFFWEQMGKKPKDCGEKTLETGHGEG